MAKTTFTSPEELRKAWEKRQARIQAQTPRTFKTFCAQAHQLSLYHMNRLVYMQNSPNRRSAAMKRGERLVFLGKGKAIIINTVKSDQGILYPLAIHEGRKAMKAPTRRGKRVFAWLWNRARRRPTTSKKWHELVERGEAVITRRVKAVKGRPWRKHMLTSMRRKLAAMTSEDRMRIFKSTR